MHTKKEKAGCIFCEAASGADDARSLVAFRGEHSFVILNRFPYTSGHIMIAPYGHVRRLAMVSDATAEEIMTLTRRSENVIESIYRPDGLNLGMNLGEAAGAGIEQHIHMHVLPRWSGDANFMTSVGATRIIPEALEETYAKISEAFRRLSS